MVRQRSSGGNSTVRGAIAVEFAFMLFVFIGLMTFVGEIYRISMYDQALARATHYGALAAALDASRCQAAFRDGFVSDGLARWLFDQDDDGTVTVLFDDDPGDAEVRVVLASDTGTVSDGLTFRASGCGAFGVPMSARASVSIRTGFGMGSVTRVAESWSVSQG